jgi:hypothetical protein
MNFGRKSAVCLEAQKSGTYRDRDLVQFVGEGKADAAAGVNVRVVCVACAEPLEGRRENKALGGQRLAESPAPACEEGAQVAVRAELAHNGVQFAPALLASALSRITCLVSGSNRSPSVRPAARSREAGNNHRFR